MNGRNHQRTRSCSKHTSIRIWRKYSLIKMWHTTRLITLRTKNCKTPWIYWQASSEENHMVELDLSLCKSTNQKLEEYFKEDLDPCNFDIGNPYSTATMFMAIFATCYTQHKFQILRNCFINLESKTYLDNMEYYPLVFYNYGPNLVIVKQSFFKNIIK